jgi:dTMP kinase
VDVLTQRGVDCVPTKEPTATSIGDFVREISETVSGNALAALVAGDRWNHVETVIAPALIRDAVVVTDRFVPSSLVLQTLDGVPLSYITAINRGLPTPALTLFLDCSDDVLAERRARRRGSTRFERQGDVALEGRLYRAVSDRLSKHCLPRILVCDSEAMSPIAIAENAASRIQAIRAQAVLAR